MLLWAFRRNYRSQYRPKEERGAKGRGGGVHEQTWFKVHYLCCTASGVGWLFFFFFLQGECSDFKVKTVTREEAIPYDDILSWSPYRWIKKLSQPLRERAPISSTFPSAAKRPSLWSRRCALPQVEKTQSLFLQIHTLERMEPVPWYPVPNAACRFMLVSVSFFTKVFWLLRYSPFSLCVAYIWIPSWRACYIHHSRFFLCWY